MGTSTKLVFASPLSPVTVWRAFALGSQWKTTASIVASDAFALGLVFVFAVVWRHLLSPAYALSYGLHLMPCAMMLLVAFWAQGLYPGVLLHSAEEMRRIVFSASVVFLVVASTSFLVRNVESYSRSVFLVSWVAAPPTVLLMRYILRRWLAGKRWWGVPALVLGTGPIARRVVLSMQNGSSGVKVVGVLSAAQVESWPEDFPPILGDIIHCPNIAESGVAQYVIVAMPEKSAIEIRHAIQDYCRGFSHVFFVPDMPGVCSLGVSAREIGAEFGLEMPQRLFHKSAAVCKRVLDLILGSLALLIALPLFIVISTLIKLTSRGPVFYEDRRFGRNGAVIKALKFRTMVPNAAVVLADYLAAHPELRLEWQRDHKLKNDPRVTMVGKWLRRLSLDELPQLLNVLAGEMSLVGPRPIVEAEIEKYGRGYGLYTRVLPGLTGLWQVSGRNNTTYRERVGLDEYYVCNWSIWLDAYILIRTVKVVLTGEGAY
jgi:Undecaprenyl-phosphate galactose phosphotransferase WbaP